MCFRVLCLLGSTPLLSAPHKEPFLPFDALGLLDYPSVVTVRPSSATLPAAPTAVTLLW